MDKKILFGVLFIGVVLGAGFVMAFEIHELYTLFDNSNHQIRGSWNVEDTGEQWHGAVYHIDDHIVKFRMSVIDDELSYTCTSAGE